MNNVGKARFKEMLANIIKRRVNQRRARRMKKLKQKKSIFSIQIRVLVIAIAIVVFIMLSGCSGNYRIGDTSKVYCQPVHGYDPIEKSNVTEDEATVEY